jgi:hypothetical protein
MKHIAFAATVLMAIGLLAGCNTLGRQPKLRDASMSPALVKPGDTGFITVKLNDKRDVVARIEGVVRGYERMKLDLHDDGADGDKKAGDGVWTLQVDVPYEAPPGQFLVELTAYNDKGEPVLVKNEKGNVVPLMDTCEVVIALPPEPPAEAAPPPQ